MSDNIYYMTVLQQRELAELRAEVEGIHKDNAALRAELNLTMQVIEQLTDADLEKIPEAKILALMQGMDRADKHRHVQSKMDELNTEARRLREEMASVLGDWNALVKATGSSTNGAAVGHANKLRADNKLLVAALEGLCSDLVEIMAFAKLEGDESYRICCEDTIDHLKIQGLWREKEKQDG